MFSNMARRIWFAIALMSCLLGGAQWVYASSDDAWIVSQQQPNTPVWLLGRAQQLPDRVPIGSLWKLWVYAYSLDNHVPDLPYACRAGSQAVTGDEYCCSQSESVGRDVALVRSCGAYFQPKRLGIQSRDWRNYWQRHAPNVTWLQNLENLQPQTQVSVGDILNALNSVPAPIVERTREALLGRLLQPQWSDVLPVLGGAYRFKTYTWQHPSVNGAYFGGAAGWQADGTAFWLGAPGGSHRVVQRLSEQLVSRLPPPTQALNLDDQCVSVHFFRNYPIKRISRTLDSSHVPITNGHLRGDYQVEFVNQHSMNIHTDGELSVLSGDGIGSHRPSDRPLQIWGHLSLQDYLARVLDREGDAAQTQAARALSIAAHSYLLQNAQFHQGCWQIDDDSRHQRVSANPPSQLARSVVSFTEGLTLGGSPIYYHRTQAKAGTVLSWQDTVKQSKQGVNYITLLKQAYPSVSWQLPDHRAQCVPFTIAQTYFKANLNKVQQLMMSTAGFEHLSHVNICQLDYGHPYADQQALNIYLSDWRTQNDHVTLWHEYLHLALRFHPKGQDEDWIELTARQLTDRLELSGVAPAQHPIRKIHYAQ